MRLDVNATLARAFQFYFARVEQAACNVQATYVEPRTSLRQHQRLESGVKGELCRRC